MKRVREVAEIGGYCFCDGGLYELALLPSGGKGGKDNERLEFLGDRVLGLVVAEALYKRLPESDEGSLSLRLARLVEREGLLRVCDVLGMEGHLRVESAEKGSRGYLSLLADSVEAMVAAVYLDGGGDAARDFVLRVWKDEIERVCGEDVEAMKDSKTRLQEYCQREYGLLPSYRVVRDEGADHAKEFEVEVMLGEGDVMARGVGSSKKRAETEGATKALRVLEERL